MNKQSPCIWPTPKEHFLKNLPDAPVLYFAPHALKAKAQVFQQGFGGAVSYAVKANSRADVLRCLTEAGIGIFDVASPKEMQAVRAVNPKAMLNYHNPIRSLDEIALAKTYGITSWSVDALSELDKLGNLPEGSEIAVRIKLPLEGGAYNFGEKFGATPEKAVPLLKEVVARGLRPSLTFHPGTQCSAPKVWAAYIGAAAQVAQEAGVTLERLNVGGGFPSDRDQRAPDLTIIFDQITTALNNCFHAKKPNLTCEPGRGLVADSIALVVRVKNRRPDGALVWNDGVYGALAEWRDLPPVQSRHIAVCDPFGNPRRGPLDPRIVFGPTCDSLDRLKEPLPLPQDIDEGDFILIQGLGAYSIALACRFNGYGTASWVTCENLEADH